MNYEVKKTSPRNENVSSYLKMIYELINSVSNRTEWRIFTFRKHSL